MIKPNSTFDANSPQQHPAPRSNQKNNTFLAPHLCYAFPITGHQKANPLFTRALTLILSLTALPSTQTYASPDIPAWLQRHVGTGTHQIAPVVLDRARALYHKNLRKRRVHNACYYAMDATRPSTASNGQALPRFYTICEKDSVFRATSSGYGDGRKMIGANFRNGRQCAKNFSNAEGSNLTMGGAYITAESRTSFKGYYSQGGQLKPFLRTFLLFDGVGETKNARERAIGGHQAAFLKWQCRKKMPASPYADAEGYVPIGRLVDYTSGRSNGCTTWNASATSEILSQVDRNPTTLYIYPERKDIKAVATAAKKGQSLSPAGLYWNASCLKAISAPTFWSKPKLQPTINAWRKSLPKSEARPLPICN